jgi:hypothetical protein
MSVLRRCLRGLAGPAALTTAAVLLAAALWKFADLDSFRRILESHGVVPARWLPATALAVPAIEAGVAVGACVAVQRERRVGAALLLLSAVLVAMAGYGLAMHLHPPPRPVRCGCGFGSAVVRDWSAIVLRNGAWAAGLACLALVSRPARDMPVAGSAGVCA